MENVNNDFARSITDAVFEVQQLGFYLHVDNSPEPGDEDENEVEVDEDQSETSNADDPPLDDEVVHSPLPPQTGGKPRK